MLEINVNIHFPGLPLILETIRTAITPKAVLPDVPDVPSEAPGASVSDPEPEPVVIPPAPETKPAATPEPPTVPTAAPAITLAQVAKAGADLLTANRDLQPKLVELLQGFGAATVKDLPPDRLGEFAEALRGLGAKI